MRIVTLLLVSAVLLLGCSSDSGEEIVKRYKSGERIFVKEDLRGANLKDAYLDGADFSGTDLKGVNLNGAYLSGANFNNADLSTADLKDAKLYSAHYNASTKFPPNFDPKKRGMIQSD
ncbi:MAG: pentapeptide repeat-containing protein [Deltaproteobacteria bacterium]|nr:pentapeptide repeat-containing protein [Deltaproteobacteria bacterium]